MQKITTPGGETMIVLPLKEYEDLLDAADITLADKIKSAIIAGEDELVPSEMADRILDGESPVKVWREYRSMTARQLAAETGMSAAYISEIENGRKEGSISALKKIAKVLSVDLDDIA